MGSIEGVGHFGVDFANMAQFGDVFTPKRWELVESLKASGSLSIYALAKRLGRHYRNVHKDTAAQAECGIKSRSRVVAVSVASLPASVATPFANRHPGPLCPDGRRRGRPAPGMPHCRYGWR
ncbi:MAG: HVO_A0114 family putative DNA-binding protein [Acidithiobacillus sp.]